MKGQRFLNQKLGKRRSYQQKLQRRRLAVAQRLRTEDQKGRTKAK